MVKYKGLTVFEVLEACFDYFDERSDVDDGIPNEEMKLFTNVDIILRKVYNRDLRVERAESLKEKE